MTSEIPEARLAAAQETREQMEATIWYRLETADGKTWVDNYLRILPPHSSMGENFYAPVPVHFRVGPTRTTVPCPRKALGSLCPICVAGFSLLGRNKQQEAQDLLPSWQGYMNAVKLDAQGQPAGENPVVQVVSGSRKHVIDPLIELWEKLDAKGEPGNFTDLATGRNINIRRRGTGPQKSRFDVVAAAPSPFDYPDLVAARHDLTTVSPYRPVEYLAALLEPPAHADPFVGQAPEQAKLAEPVEATGAMAFAPPPEDDTDGVPGPADEPQQEAPSSDQNDAARERLRALNAEAEQS